MELRALALLPKAGANSALAAPMSAPFGG